MMTLNITDFTMLLRIRYSFFHPFSQLQQLMRCQVSTVRNIEAPPSAKMGVSQSGVTMVRNIAFHFARIIASIFISPLLHLYYPFHHLQHRHFIHSLSYAICPWTDAITRGPKSVVKVFCPEIEF